MKNGLGKLIKLTIPKRKFASLKRKNLFEKHDFPSMVDFVEAHENSFLAGRTMKGMFTSDLQTIQAASDVLLSKTPSPKLGGDKTAKFFGSNIFHQPPLSTMETGSIKVLISDLSDFPEFKRQHDSKKGEDVMMCVGGPAAEDQIVMASIMENIRTRLIYVTKDYLESNVNHSAKQSNARHGTTLNADTSLSGHGLLPVLLMRKLIGVTLQDVLEPDYKKVDVEFTIDPAKLKIYFGNELNWLQKRYQKLKGDLTEDDVNRIESVLSQEILIALEEQTGAKISGGLARAREDSSSIHITFNSRGDKHVAAEHADLQAVGITAEKLSPEKRELFFGPNNHIHEAFEYKGDSHILFDAHQTNKDLAEERGATWIDGKEISRILVRKNPEGNAEIAGTVTKDNEYHYCNKLHFTGGYKVKYSFDPLSAERFEGSFLRNLMNKIEDVLGLQSPLTNEITTATGISVNAIFRNSPRLKSIIKHYGSTGELAVTNSHWTMIAKNEDYIVIRMTGGGNTGSEEYQPAYFLNLLANTRRIFGDDPIGILSTYGCPRAVNARNSTEFAKIAEGGIVSYGKGGTGNTKRHIEAAFGLMMLDFEEEVVEHFNNFQTKQGKALGDELLESYKMAEKVGFIHDNKERTNRRMGYDDSLSTEEMLAIAGFITILSVGLAKKLIQHVTKDSAPSR